MGYIYKITNILNQKSYIGKTEKTIEERWKLHLSDSKKRSHENRPLYRALNKYGFDNFSIEELEKVESSKLIEREIFWINYYGTYLNGYNATLGGDGKTLFNYEDIYNEYVNNKTSTKELSQKFECSTDTIINALKSFDIEIINYSNLQMKEEKSISVSQYDKNMNYINNFKSMADAARWLVNNNYAKNYNSGVRSHISDVCNGKRKSAYSFIWKINYT